MKLNLGAGDTKKEGFVSVDFYDKAADIQQDVVTLDLPDNSVDEMTAYQLIEHLPYNKTSAALANWFRMLRRGGRLVIECPDLVYVCHNILEDGLHDKWLYNLYGEYYRPWDTERYPDWEYCQAAIHRQGFTFDRLKMELDRAGFTDIRRLPEVEMESKCPENLAVEAYKL